jgi:DNA mismatch repair protein MutL
MLLTDHTLIVRAVPGWLRQTVLNQWLEQWLQQLCQHDIQQPLQSLLSMLLNANGVSAATVLTCAAQLLDAPQYWVSVPLQLDTTLRLFSQAAS